MLFYVFEFLLQLYASPISASAYQLHTHIDVYSTREIFIFTDFKLIWMKGERAPQVHMIYFSPKNVKMIDGEHCAMRGNLLTRNNLRQMGTICK